MKIVLNEKICLKHKLTLQELLVALAVRGGKVNEVMDNLISREVIVERNGVLYHTALECCSG